MPGAHNSNYVTTLFTSLLFTFNYQALLKQLESTEVISQKEKGAVMLAISLLPTPNARLINTIEEIIERSSDKQSTLLLVYGSIASNVPGQTQRRMVQFLSDIILKEPRNVPIIIHILHSLGNTKALDAMADILPFTFSYNNNVKKTSIYALRFFTGHPVVQQKFISILRRETAKVFIEVMIKSLHTGYEYNTSIVLDEELVHCLIKATFKTNDNYIIKELGNLFEKMDIPITMDLIRDNDNIIRKRNIVEGDSTSEVYNSISSLSDRETDLRNYPVNRGYLWNQTLGLDEGDYKVYVQGVAGLFGGANLDTCDVKLFGRAVIRGHVLGNEAIILDVLEDNGKFYIEFVGMVILDVDPMLENYQNFNFTYELPSYSQKLISLEYVFVVYGVPIDFSLDVYASIGGELNINIEQGTDGSVEGTGSLTPNVVMSADGSIATIAPIVSQLLLMSTSK